MIVRYCRDCGKSSIKVTVKDHRSKNKLSGVTIIGPLCDSCYRDRQHRKRLAKMKK